MNSDRQIVEAFERNFRDYGELGASVSVWKDGKEIVSLHSGFAVADETRPWTEHSLVPVYSLLREPLPPPCCWPCTGREPHRR